MTSKILTKNDLPKIRKNFRNKRIGLAHGVFDLFHYGHLLHLKSAKSKCDVLIVSITAKKFVSKGPGRPYYNDAERLQMISALNDVDYVVISNSKSSGEIINKLKPNLYFKGKE